MPGRTDTLDLLLEVVVLLDADMETQLAARGLTKARTHVLWELARRGIVHQRVLADAVGVTPRTMTGLLDGLEATDFVVRRQDPADRRAFRIELTARGREAADWLVASHEELATSLFGSMSTSRHKAFATELAEVRDRLRAAVEAAS